MTAVYHEIDNSSLQDVIRHGLKRTSRGNKGEDKNIIETDAYLDDHRPAHLRDKDVSRDNNLYAYLVIDDKISDITDGSLVPINEFVNNSNDAVLRLNVNPVHCFVSDLDIYDELKNHITKSKDSPALEKLAQKYWNRLCSLNDYAPYSIARPELMITYDIDPKDILYIDH